MNFPVFDLHCDTAYELLGKSKREMGSLRNNKCHIDLERASALPGYAQCFACFTTPLEKLPEGISVSDLFEREMITVLREVESNKKLISQAFSANEIAQNYKNGIMSAILTIEVPAGFEIGRASCRERV